eukprot:375551_1
MSTLTLISGISILHNVMGNNMYSVEPELASMWWVQALIMICLFIIIYILMEFWRYYLFISCYVIVSMNICLLPFIFRYTFGFCVKWLILSPNLILFTLWRISHIELKNNKKPFWKNILLLFSKFIFRYL